MRWLPRVAVAFTLSALAIVALTWAGWPRPRSVTRIDGLARVTFAHSLPGTASRFRLIQQGEYGNCDAGFWFLGPDGTLREPWQPGRPMLLLGFDAAGRLLACSPYGPERGGFLLARYDPETGHVETVLSLDGLAPSDLKLSRDFSTLALASTDPLAFDIYDVADGRKRTRLSFPDRAGGLDAWHDSQPKLAAFAWELSTDGRQLLLAEAWDGLKRLTPQGIDVYEVATSRLARRLVHRGDPVPAALPGESPDFGVGSIDFTGDGRSVGSFLYRRKFDAKLAEWSTDNPVGFPECDYATGDPRPEVIPPPDDDRGHRVATDGGRALWLHGLPEVYGGSPSAYRVTDLNGTVLVDWRLPPRDFAPHGLGGTPQPGRPAMVYSYGEPPARPVDSNLFWFARWLNRSPSLPTSTYWYHDWGADEFRSFPGPVAGGQTHAVGPHDLAILTHAAAGGTLTLWDLPPPRPPWLWSVPAGVAFGVLVTAAGVRLRRRVQWPRRLPAETRRCPT